LATLGGNGKYTAIHVKAAVAELERLWASLVVAE
jgi:hypothetical protein